MQKADSWEPVIVTREFNVPVREIWEAITRPHAGFQTSFPVESNGRVFLHQWKVTEPFPGDIPEFTRDGCLGGWKYFITISLPGFLIPLS